MCNLDAGTLQPEELCLLRLYEDQTTLNEEFNTVIVLLREGRFEELFQHTWFSIFRCSDLHTFPEQLGQNILKLESPSVRLLTSAAVFLCYFIQQNFVGPVHREDATAEIFSCAKQRSFLDVDGENAYHLVKAPMALYIARLILIDHADMLQLASAHVWRRRYAILHQQTLPERVSSLQSIVMESTVELEKGIFSQHPDLRTEQHLEAALANLDFFQITTTEKLLLDVSKTLGVTIELTGALGTRTYYQTNSVAQLMLKVSCTKPSNIPISSVMHARENLPIDIALTDDTVMNQIKFDLDQDNSTLSHVEQALILAMSMLRKRLNASEELRDEEVMAFLNTILSQPQLWTLQFSALFQRSTLECVKSRKAERALSQYQTLLDSISKEGPDFGNRCRMFFTSRLPTIWKLKRDLANGYTSLGLTKSALDIYIRLELWEEVVECYQRLQRNDRAEAIVRELLQDEKTPHLYCLLGDVTGDPENYRLAWELSKESNARAKRSWGSYHFQRKEYKEAIPHLRQSLELNRLHYRAWQQLAFSYMKMERFEECVLAYKRVVNIDSDNFEAWNNMAKAYISLGDKEKAFRVLQESIKCNYEDWRIWENYILVSMDVGAFSEVVKSWHRLIDIKGKHSDPKIAHLLVQVVEKDIKDFDGHSAAVYLRSKLFELFGRATACIINDAGLWTSYGDLHVVSVPREGTGWPDHVQKMLSCYQKGLRCLVQKPNWEREVEAALQRIDLSLKVWSQLQKFSEHLSADEKRRLSGSLEMTIQNVIAMVKRGLDYHPDSQRDSIVQTLSKLEELIKL
ncbi:tetratricopeptide repeat protein 27-like [Tropilaelaps mercedesae]|uniref:Tetratricopeptide repeat protein 27-like n=1 Tax=Tropilaelaps mercedesae TaxID=418985 RepID=A0A1V9Y021_9ACAR|nr:tetratricopeptide repeat protein 27-like [Tropilaelaps mercedesae]